MNKQNLTIADGFKARATAATLSILLFIIVYLSLVVAGACFVYYCFWFGIYAFRLGISYLSLMLCIGLWVIGGLIAYFLIKFIFKRNKTDVSGLIELHEKDNPALFAFIRKVADDVQANYPKKIYLSPEVNASVFYHSSFWSMFLPIKKNLQIGMGLINTTTVEEFRAVLAHEFGHFSQRSMKIGAYVYNVNHVIYNMLYENEGYHDTAQDFANINEFIHFFVLIAMKITQGIQWILHHMYRLVNKQYMALSREMEFHADAVAAQIAGSQPMMSALLRLDLAEQSYQEVLMYYGERVSKGIKSNNIYAAQVIKSQFISQQHGIVTENNMSALLTRQTNRFSKSKIVIRDQWASHPNLSDRLTALSALNQPSIDTDRRPATVLFDNPNLWQEKLTEQIFPGMYYPKDSIIQDPSVFESEMKQDAENQSFPKVFNGYYDQHNPIFEDIKSLSSHYEVLENESVEDLFNTEKTDMVYELISIERDYQTVQYLAQAEDLSIKTFDYDGTKYKVSNAHELAVQLKADLDESKHKQRKHDKKIYRYFYEIAKASGTEQEIENHFNTLYKMDADYEGKSEAMIALRKATHFMSEETPFYIIEQNIRFMLEPEKKFKLEVEKMLSDPLYLADMSEEEKVILKTFNNRFWKYFEDQRYNDQAVENLFASINVFSSVLNRCYLKTKKQLLVFCASLI
jgi:Zn-dependent protease with chaperone function